MEISKSEAFTIPPSTPRISYLCGKLLMVFQEAVSWCKARIPHINIWQRSAFLYYPERRCLVLLQRAGLSPSLGMGVPSPGENSRRTFLPAPEVAEYQDTKNLSRRKKRMGMTKLLLFAFLMDTRTAEPGEKWKDPSNAVSGNDDRRKKYSRKIQAGKTTTWESSIFYLNWQTKDQAEVIISDHS